MNARKSLAIALAAALAAGAMALGGCGSSGSGSSDGGDASGTSDNSSAAITVVSREDGSGTRGAFIELFGIESKDDSGEKVDNTIATAEVTNSTSVMMTTVAGNVNAIGYISLGSLDDSVKALQVDGVEASVDNVKNGAYKVARPFNIATKSDLSEVASDFVSYIMSAEGQAIITENGYVSVSDGAASYTASGLTGTITVGGSSSVTPVMEKLAEAYQALNSGVTIQVQQSDSTTGMTSASEGIVDIGMASRELKDSEISAGLTGTTIAMDGIAVIVNNDNAVDDITSESVLGIYTGTITTWGEVA